MVQGELFRDGEKIETAESVKLSSWAAQGVTFQFSRILIAGLFLIAFGVVIYCFGVEQGKRAMERHYESSGSSYAQPSSVAGASSKTQTIVSRQNSSGAQELVVVANEPEPEALPEEPLGKATETSEMAKTTSPVDSSRKGKDQYTIQLVTYKDQLLAKNEVNRLREKGYESFIIPSGSFYQVCINYYQSKFATRSTLHELKVEGRYPGAYVRPVTR